LALLGKSSIAEHSLWCQILILNQQEWDSIASLQQQLLLAVERVVVTDGSRGGQVMIKGNPFSYVAHQVTSVDDTGAGDAFASGFVAAHLHERPDQEAIEWGIRNAASVVQQVGAKPGLLTRQQVSYPSV
jgi:sugar/nucleoside kinase (ribokinase family)